MIEFLKRQDEPTLAYVKYEGQTNLAPIVFLGGFRSDMEGTKALFLEQKCKERDQTYVRFDYTGHGKSEGEFINCSISTWLKDAHDILNHCLSEPAMLIGSSMGGWISFLLALKYPSKVKAFIGLAAAPDFTIWIEEAISKEQKQDLDTKGYFSLPNDYDEPYIITKNLIEDGRRNILLDKKNDIDIPIHLIQGEKDTDVPWITAERIKSSITSQDIEITYIEDGDHKLSSPDQLQILDNVILQMNKK